jgi:dihydroxyacid dehydratase/phosphogluconate dehydratase
MLRDAPSGDLFGLTQNVGMGWSPTKLHGPEYVIVSTMGGLRGEDGARSPWVSHRSLGDRACSCAKRRRRCAPPGAVPVLGVRSDPCDGRTQGTTGMFDSLAYRNDASIVMRRLIRSLPTRQG